MKYHAQYTIYNIHIILHHVQNTLSFWLEGFVRQTFRRLWWTFSSVFRLFWNSKCPGGDNHRRGVAQSPQTRTSIVSNFRWCGALAVKRAWKFSPNFKLKNYFYLFSLWIFMSVWYSFKPVKRYSWNSGFSEWIGVRVRNAKEKATVLKASTWRAIKKNRKCT